MIDELCETAAVEDLGHGYRRIALTAPVVAAVAAPGQFVHLRVPGLEASALRRPFSIFDAEGERLGIVYKVVGRGTEALAAGRAGEKIRVLGPLGRGFPLAVRGKALLIGGGYGSAPLHFLARRLLASGVAADRIEVFLGGRTAGDLVEADRFSALGLRTFLATNDGSVGEKGFVTVPLDAEIARHQAAGAPFELFACGPDPMLRAVAERAVAAKAPGWISMDRHMVCGVGACYACIQQTVRGNERCCVDGPVFAAADLVWA